MAQVSRVYGKSDGLYDELKIRQVEASGTSFQAAIILIAEDPAVDSLVHVSPPKGCRSVSVVSASLALDLSKTRLDNGRWKLVFK